MKNLKKVLSLVLALSMALSLMTVAFAKDASDYSDYSKVTYKEAVDVMTATGVIDGMGGSFNPDGTLTREQAAKIITYMLMGKDAADKLTATIAPYSDVPASRWSAGAIAYCTNEGILSGVGKGKFDPTGKLTGVAFAKMLLVALGYDPKIEQFTGDSWAINVSKKALGDAALDTGMKDISLSNELTREQAAQMAFNAMQAAVVDYENRGSNIIINGIEIAQGASKAEPVKDNGNKKGTIAKDEILQFAEKYCEDLKLTSADSDAFERPANVWSYKTNNIGTYAKDADLTYTTEVKTGTIYSDLGLAKAIASSNVTVYEDGAKATAKDIVKGGTDKFGGNGTLTEVYYDDDNNTVVITLVNTYVGDVTAVKDATSTKDAYITVAPRAAGNGGNFEATGFDVDDVVLFTYSNKSGDKGVKSVMKASVVEGKVTAYTTNEKVSVDGKSYDYSAKVANEATSAAKNYDVKLVLDSYGYAIDVDTKNTTTNYAVILQYNAKGGAYGSDAIAQLLLTDGTVKDVKLTGAVSGADKGDIVTYKVNNKDEYTLQIVGEATSKKGELVKNGDSASLFDNGAVKIANGKTIFLVATKGADGTVYTVYTGIKEVPTINASQNVTVTSAAKSSSDAASVVYIDATENTTLSTSSKDVIFVLYDSSVKKTEDSERGTFYTYNAIVNGEITKLDLANSITESGLYTGISYDTNKVATLTGKIASTGNDGVIATSTKKADDDVIGLDSKYYTYANDCKVFIVDGDGNINTSSVKAIGDRKSADLEKVYGKLTDGELTTIVVVEKANTPDKPGTETGYTVKTNASVNATAAGGFTVNNAVVNYNDAAPAEDVTGLKMTVTFKTYDNGTWNTYRTFTKDNVKIAKSTGAVDEFTNSEAMPAGIYMIDVTLTGGNVGTLSLYSGTVDVK